MKLLRFFFYPILFLTLISAISSSKSTVETEMAASKLLCGGRVWTDGEFLGNFQGSPVYTLLNENRIYIRFPRDKPVGAFDNVGILFVLDTNLFPSYSVIENCVNSNDPSTSPNNYLGTSPNGILCNGKVIPHNTLVGTYIGGDGVKTFLYAVVVDGLLRINFHREGSVRSNTQLSMSLVGPVLAGENGSFLNFPLTAAEFEGCFWNSAPKYPESIIADTPCASGPTIQTISAITSAALRLQVTGTGATSIRWKILNGQSSTVRSGTSSLTSNATNLSYQAIDAGTYTLEIEGENCTSNKSTQNFVVPVGSCAEGPSLVPTNPITNVTPTSLQFQFHGNGVNTIKWRIKSGNTTVHSGVTPQLVSSYVTVNFPQLAAGPYSFEIEGGSCQSGVTSANFTVGSSNCASGPVLSSVSNATISSLQFQFTGTGISSIGWEIVDNLSRVVRSGLVNVSANTGNLTYPPMLPGTYTLKAKGGNCISNTSSWNFVVAEASSRANCAAGPTLVSINGSSITSTGLNFNFHGENVFTLDWKISKSGTVVSKDRITLQNAFPDIAYPALSPGQYTLEIQGGSCISNASSMGFTVNTPLPIYITDLAARSSKKGVTLSWNVVSEINGDRFEVLRYKTPTTKPDILGEVPLTDKAIGSYNFIDTEPLPGTNYYQLRQIDKDGSSTLSRMISVRSEQLFEAFASPNPATEYVEISFVSRSKGKSAIHVYDLTGTKVSTIPVSITEGENNHRIKVTNFPAGNYFVKMVLNDQELKLRFIKP